MTDIERPVPFKLSRAERELQRAKILLELGVTPAEASLLNVVHYGINGPASNLPFLASCEDYRMAGPMTEDECQKALTDCFAKGWLQIVGEAFLKSMADELRAGNFLGPICGYPAVGGVDFTREGAKLWLQLAKRCRSPWRLFPPFACQDVVHVKTARYFQSQSAALAAIPEAQAGVSITTTVPIAIGPWRVQWWRRFPVGFRMDIEKRMQWTGSGEEGGASFFMDYPRERKDLQHLQFTLDRHQVTLTEWFLLASMDDSSSNLLAHLPNCVSNKVDRQFDIKVSEDDCRIALDDCFRKKWLRVVDPLAKSEVRAILNGAPALMVVPDAVEKEFGMVDFTPLGAKLYRTLAMEWLGPEWEDQLCVEHVYFCEEHRYCETEDGFFDFAYSTKKQQVIQDCKLVAIGPSCDWWWDRYASGYRMELKIESL